MNVALRIALYLALAAGIAFFGQRFIRAYSLRADQAAALRAGEDVPANPVAETTNAASAATTNAVEGQTPVPSEAAVTSTNAVSTNTPAPETTDAVAPTNAVPALPPSGGRPAPVVKAPPPLGLYAALTLGCILLLALLVAQDVSHAVAGRVHGELYNEEGEGFADPEYDRAEEVWANGEHLEALRLLRAYLAKHPREIHVAFRIAEIYEKDLANNLAAALEYEEILTRKLSPERWGWAAIHLCNLYSRMNQADKTEALLRRIIAEYGDTAAAKKARERLGLPPDSAGEFAAAETEEPPEAGPQLPPGFRRKKR